MHVIMQQCPCSATFLPIIQTLWLLLVLIIPSYWTQFCPGPFSNFSEGSGREASTAMNLNLKAWGKRVVFTVCWLYYANKLPNTVSVVIPPVFSIISWPESIPMAYQTPPNAMVEETPLWRWVRVSPARETKKAHPMKPGTSSYSTWGLSLVNTAWAK